MTTEPRYNQTKHMLADGHCNFDKPQYRQLQHANQLQVFTILFLFSHHLSTSFCHSANNCAVKYHRIMFFPIVLSESTYS